MAHTPAPWTWRWSQPLNTLVIEAGDGYIARNIGNDNARLIAAAPDLLAACHKLIDSDAAVEEDERKHQLLLAKLLAAQAIAKAEGITMEGTNGKERSLD